jgi:hypothetical protein
MSTDNLYGELSNLWETFQENHSKFVETGNKAAGARARKALNGIKKLVTPYKKQSVIDCK